jgi:uncharacterized protein with FMN-binding domain
MLKKVLLSLAVISSFTSYALYQNFNTPTQSTEVAQVTPSSAGLDNQVATTSSQPVATIKAVTSSVASQARAVVRRFEDDDEEGEAPVTNPLPISTPTPTPTPVSTPAPVAVPVASTGRYKNGTYTGVVADAYYGNIQVAAVISGGHLSDVQILDYPRDRNTSVRINTNALPILKTEAIKAQSAKVNAVSGASETSRAFVESLSSALFKAS